jgi:hypothetical protein
MDYTERSAGNDGEMNSRKQSETVDEKPNVARLAKPFVRDGVWENNEWELLEYDPDAVFNTVCNDEVIASGSVSGKSDCELVEFVAEVVADECEIEFSRGVVLATKKEIMREYDLTVESVLLYLIKNDGEEKKFDSIVGSFGSKNKRNLNPKVLIQNTYRSMRHLITHVSRTITRNKDQTKNIPSNNINDNE